MGREALQRISATQARCLVLKAEGLSYDEIAAETGFSRPKVHRALTDGRRVFRGLVWDGSRMEGNAAGSNLSCASSSTAS